MTRLGYFLKVLATNFIAKVAQNFGYFVTILEYINFLLWTHLGNFCVEIGQLLGESGQLKMTNQHYADCKLSSIGVQ